MRIALQKRERGRGEAGTALTEFALCLPVITMVICGSWTIISLLGARYQMALIAHAVMREATGGVMNDDSLSVLAQGYARAMNARRLERISVEIGSAGPPADAGPLVAVIAHLVPASVVRVRANVVVPGPLGRAWPDGMNLECSTVCLLDPWKDPLSILGDLMALLLSSFSGGG